jgi:flagellar protein FliS
MSYAKATAAYRDNEVLSATPGRLVVIVYDYLIVQLSRAAIAIDSNNVELRIVSLENALNAVGELLGGLDIEKGGTIARDLSGLYSFFFARLVDVGRTCDKATLLRIITQVSELRESFAQISTTQSATAA